MSSPLRTIRAFSTELMKLAAGIKDADIQKLLSNRKGEEYLPGGKLPSNSIEDEMLTEKQAAGGYTAPVGMAASGNYDHHAKKKKPNTYQKLRDYAGAGVKGGLTGLGILGAANAMRGRFGAPTGAREISQAARAAQRAATVGAGVAVADRAYRHDDVPGMGKSAGVISQGLSRSFGSPAGAAATARRTGGFKSSISQRPGKPPKTVQLGQKFKLP